MFPFFSSSCCGLVCCYLCFHEGVGCLGYLRHLRLVTISSWTEVPLGKSFRERTLTELRQRPSCSQSRTSIDALRRPPHPWNLKSESPSYDQHIVVQRFTGYSIEGEKKNPCFSFLHSGGKRGEGAANEQMGATRGAGLGVRRAGCESRVWGFSRWTRKPTFSILWFSFRYCFVSISWASWFSDNILYKNTWQIFSGKLSTLIISKSSNG